MGVVQAGALAVSAAHPAWRHPPAIPLLQEYAQEALEAVHGTGQEAGGAGPAAASSSLGVRGRGAVLPHA